MNKIREAFEPLGTIMKTQATPTPWQLIGRNLYTKEFSNYDKEPICKMYSPIEANAALIVKCVNMHDELITFLDKLHSMVIFNDTAEINMRTDEIIEMGKLLKKAKVE